eukprot:TRINITY_DN9091_c0_g2_i3.p2 TRINITY_DN9091_c0_g2~~TRINITY_DN9091_c0_g2_i3.p2  ORF type:complete len:282 (-),score=79.35 TRINITY_DN9091_c0_g2_i3:425-1270(-)
MNRPTFDAVLKFLKDGVKTEEYFGSMGEASGAKAEEVAPAPEQTTAQMNEQLEALGFDKQHAAAALLACGGDVKAATGYLTAMARSVGQEQQASEPEPELPGPSNPKVTDLTQMGFDKTQAAAALLAAGDDFQVARTYLLNKAKSHSPEQAELVRMGFTETASAAALASNKGNFEAAVSELCSASASGATPSAPPLTEPRPSRHPPVDRLSGREWNVHARALLGCPERSSLSCWACGSRIEFRQDALHTMCSCGTVSMCNGKPCDSLYPLMSAAGYYGKVR